MDNNEAPVSAWPPASFISLNLFFFGPSDGLIRCMASGPPARCIVHAGCQHGPSFADGPVFLVLDGAHCKGSGFKLLDMFVNFFLKIDVQLPIMFFTFI